MRTSPALVCFGRGLACCELLGPVPVLEEEAHDFDDEALLTLVVANATSILFLDDLDERVYGLDVVVGPTGEVFFNQLHEYLLIRFVLVRVGFQVYKRK